MKRIVLALVLVVSIAITLTSCMAGAHAGHSNYSSSEQHSGGCH